MKTKYIKLGEVATYINGYAFKPKDRGSIVCSLNFLE